MVKGQAPVAPSLDPLELLFQAPDLPQYPLPDQLSELYGGPFGLPKQLLYSNFVSSLDGVAVVGPSSGSALSGDSRADRFVMGLLRACAEAILIGSGTLVGSPGHLWTAEHVFPPAAAAYRELRRRLGLAERPALVVVSGTGKIPIDHPGLRRGGLLLTSDQGLSRLAPAKGCRVASLGAQSRLDPLRIVGALREAGHQVVLTEGGPRLMGSLLRAGQLDQLFLTVSPVLAGTHPDQRRPGFVDGVDLLRGERRSWLDLLSARRHHSHLFLRYRQEDLGSSGAQPPPS
jgi:riboflavin biosynthesis pyrimidine reductase